MKVYGIKNCDTVKKALNWLDSNEIDYEFHDYKKLGVDAEKLKKWSEKLGSWEKLVNRKGTTWKKLDPEVQATINAKEPAIQLMQEKTSLIKRPLIEVGESIVLGFDPIEYEQKLK